MRTNFGNTDNTATAPEMNSASAAPRAVSVASSAMPDERQQVIELRQQVREIAEPVLPRAGERLLDDDLRGVDQHGGQAQLCEQNGGG